MLIGTLFFLLLKKNNLKVNFMNAKKKTAWQKSAFGRINTVDLLNALAHALAASVPTFFGLINAELVIKSFSITITEATTATAIAFFSAFCFDVIKRLNTNSEGKFSEKEA